MDSVNQNKVKTRSLITLFLLLVIVRVSGQTASIALTFTAERNGEYARLDSIKVMNRSQGGENSLYYPDTTLSIEITPGDVLLYIGYMTGYPVGVQEIHQKSAPFRLFQSSPNPVKEQCIVSMYLPEDGNVRMRISEIRGRTITTEEKVLEKGFQHFHFVPGSSPVYFLSASWKNQTASTKIINAEPGRRMNCRLAYAGCSEHQHSRNASLGKNSLVVLESGIPDNPSSNKIIAFRFTTNLPCPGTPTVEYQGQVYNTIQIFSQCWMKENLNVGLMINGNQNQTNNGIVEKYCYDNNPDSCTRYGGLYQWEEMMQYSSQQGTRGICPPDWHLPTDEEWMVLEGAVDSQVEIGDNLWENAGWRGTDAGTNLKTTTGWNENGNGTDLFGFAGLPGGCRGFKDIGTSGYWWTSTEQDDMDKWHRFLYSADLEVNRSGNYRLFGLSVRCIKDN